MRCSRERLGSADSAMDGAALRYSRPSPFLRSAATCQSHSNDSALTSHFAVLRHPNDSLGFKKKTMGKNSAVHVVCMYICIYTHVYVLYICIYTHIYAQRTYKRVNLLKVMRSPYVTYINRHRDVQGRAVASKIFYKARISNPGGPTVNLHPNLRPH